MTAPLHLLRGFVQWNDGRPGCGQIKTIDEAEGWVRYIADRGFDEFSTVTMRRPARAAELEGGSVFFVGGPKRRHTLFRMPFIGLEDYGGAWAILMRPELIRVEQRAVGMVRGWRYLADADAPPDLADAAPVEADDMPPAMRRELEELGL